jgi:uncharacterized HAD superfamily protein
MIKTGPSPEQSSASIFADFQKSEYDHIAEAHFKSIEAISVFFRYYLIVMSLPLPMLAVLFGFVGRSENLEKAAISLLGLASPFFIGVGIVGLCMAVYITNLKMDVVLYSRVVNSIRKYFYDIFDADYANKLLMRQLPQSAYYPAYRDGYFGFVIFALAAFNVLYVGFGSHLLFLWQVKKIATFDQLGFATYSPVEFVVFIMIALLLVCAHFVVYLAIARHREFEYLKSNAIGVDIDGVLNKHREKFCEMAGTKLNKIIRPDEIRVLPVSDNKDLAAEISRSDERKIFNDPSYWTEMPELEGAADAIRSIRSAFLLPVHVFTHRPWPDARSDEIDPHSDVKAFRRAWRSAADDMLQRADAKACTRAWVYFATRFDYRASIKYITKYWLLSRGIKFDSLLVERGNENIIYARGRYENRFNYAKKKKIRFFVEDDWVKAIKLSYICDAVFLIDHPYNRTLSYDASTHADDTIVGKLPSNVIRVKSWSELKKTIAQLV